MLTRMYNIPRVHKDIKCTTGLGRCLLLKINVSQILKEALNYTNGNQSHNETDTMKSVGKLVGISEFWDSHSTLLDTLFFLDFFTVE